MPKKTEEERRLQRSRNYQGTAIILVYVLNLVAVTSFLPQMYLSCIGNTAHGGGKGSALVRTILAFPCSPFLFREGLLGWMMFVVLWVPPVAVAWLYFRARRQDAERKKQRALERKQHRREQAAQRRQAKTDAPGA